MILLDTNICIYLINQRPAHVIEKFQKYRAGELGISSVVAAELAYGVAKSSSQKNRDALEMFLAPFEILPFDENSVWAFGELRSHLEQRGESIDSLDALIAAHALSLDALLITNNIKKFAKVPKLKLDNWAA
jgi:tRNA(fMet)-specific endonuclease VapC